VGPTLHLNSARLDHNLGVHTASKLGNFVQRSRASRWLTQMEEDNRFIVYEADPLHAGATPWTRCCIRQADCILLLALDGCDTIISPTERDLLWDNSITDTEATINFARHKDLIVLHPRADPTQLPTGTALWLAGRGVASHHHVRHPVDNDYRRIARFLAGQTGILKYTFIQINPQLTE
jgi:hypothetical protein